MRLKGVAGKSAAERVLARVEFDPFGGCWLWSGTPNSGGYGFVKNSGRSTAVHRLSYEFHNGPIPDGEGYHGVCVLHKCDIRVCVNPEHLRLGTQSENIADAEAKGRGRHPAGETNALAKLTDEKVEEIRRLLATDAWTQQKIADHMGVTQSAISKIKLGLVWRQLTSQPASRMA